LQRQGVLAGEVFPGDERALPVARQVAGHAEVVPGDRFLPLVAERAVEIQRLLRLERRAGVLRQQPEGRTEAGACIGLRAPVAVPTRDQDRGALFHRRTPAVAAVPRAGAEEVMQARGRLEVSALADRKSVV